MGCEPLPHLDVGVRRHKLGEYKTAAMSHRQYKKYKERQVSLGAFQLSYTDRQLNEMKQKGGIGMVDLSTLPAFVTNDYQKRNITNTEQFFNPSKRRFDTAYNTI